MTDFSIVSLSRGLLGIVVLLLIGFLFSENKKNINWKQVGIALGAQVLLAFCVLYIPFVGNSFEFLGKIFIKLVDFTNTGTTFLIGDLMRPDKYGFIFIFQTLPIIIFFSALTSLLYYWGVIQKVTHGVSWLFRKALRVSGAEGLAVTGNVFLGLSEVPLLIKEYLSTMNKSEIFLVMTAGMSTISAGLIGAYISMLGGDDPATRLLFAKHLISASVMAAPGAIVFSRLIVPQTEKLVDHVPVQRESAGSNVLDALTKGASQGAKIFINVAAMLLTFIALIAFVNYLLGDLLGHYTGLNGYVSVFSGGQFKVLNLQFIFGTVFAPLMWLIGIAQEDIILVGALLGQKMVLNEFVAFVDMNQLKNAGMFFSQKSMIMSTYLLCGFANFGSIGMQIGAISSLAPATREWVTKYGFRSVVSGTLVSAMSASIVGMILV